jgi:Holliday junction resolvasome RuvABC endonuclease subunit
MKILALDTAIKTGWALFDGKTGKIIESGVQSFAKRRGESNGLVFLRFRRWLSDFASDTGLFDGDLIAYEQAHFRGAGTELLVGLQTRVQEVAAEMGITSAPVHTGTLKKWATGKGNAGKKEMIAAARKVLGREPVDDNEADAVLVAVWANNEYMSGG